MTEIKVEIADIGSLRAACIMEMLLIHSERYRFYKNIGEQLPVGIGPREEKLETSYDFVRKP